MHINTAGLSILVICDPLVHAHQYSGFKHLGDRSVILWYMHINTAGLHILVICDPLVHAHKYCGFKYLGDL
jgi:hypothetical protein